MNKVLKGLLISALAVSGAQAHHHNKTFLLPRAQGVNLPMETTTFVELTQTNKEDKFGGHFQVVPFYQQSTNHDNTARYFMGVDKSTMTLRAAAHSDAVSEVEDMDVYYIIHNHDAAAITDENTTISLDPEQTVYGARIDYHQDLDKILKGLYLKADLPIVHVENDPHLKIASDVTLPESFSTTSLKTNLEKYFKGEVPTGGDSDKQEALKYGKINGEQSETGVADIDLALGYKFLNREKYHAALAIAITIPTGNESDAVYMFQPIVGNGKHFGLGGDLWGDLRVWGNVDHNIKLALKMKYRYLFENSEKRTYGIKDRVWGQYHLLVEAPIDAHADTTLIPAANRTTFNCDVTPGSQFDGIFNFAYNNGGFTFDLGYNLYFREAEEVSRKDSFTDNKDAIAARNLDTADIGATALPNPIVTGIANVTDGGAAGGAAATNDAILKSSILDHSAAETPSQCTNSIYGGLGYIFKEWDTPLMFNIGGKYEWPTKNSALEQWGIWGKIGIGF